MGLCVYENYCPKLCCWFGKEIAISITEWEWLYIQIYFQQNDRLGLSIDYIKEVIRYVYVLVKDVSSYLLGCVPIVFRFFLVDGKIRSERSYTCRLFLIDGKRRSERSYTCAMFHCPLPHYTEMFCNCNLNNMINTACTVQKSIYYKKFYYLSKENILLIWLQWRDLCWERSTTQIQTRQVLPEEWEQT